MSLKRELRQLEVDLAAMIARLQELQQRVESMEEQNSRLLERVNGEELQGNSTRVPCLSCRPYNYP